MQFWNHYITGVEDLWCLLAVNVFLLAFITVRLVRARSSQRVTRLASDESGATYMLPLVLTMPFYVLLITMIIECTLMLTAKLGSVGAAYSAARAAAVWLPYENAMPKNAPDYTSLESRQNMVRLAAARAMFPYASGSTSHASDISLDQFADATANKQIAALQAYSGNQKFDVEYLKRKFAYAYNSSTVEITYFDPESGHEYGDREVPAFNAKLQLTLRYEAPIHTYGIGRLFGERSQFGRHFVRPLVTTVVIENEGVKQSPTRGSEVNIQKRSSLGIRYYGLTKQSFQSPQPQLAFRDVEPDGSVTINNLTIPIYRVPSGSVDDKGHTINAGRYQSGVIYLVRGADAVHRANEVQHARDDARDGKLNGIMHNSLDGTLEGAGKGPELTYLQSEIRSDQASAAAIEKMNLPFEFLANWRFDLHKYRQRINYFNAIDPLVQAGNYEDARKKPKSDFMSDKYIEEAIRIHQERSK